MILSDVINKNAIQVNMRAQNKEQAISMLAALLQKDGAVKDSERFIQDVYQREREGKTGIGGYIAIPHGKSEFVAHTCIAIGLLDQPINWESLDGNPVKVVILFAVNKKDKNDYSVKMMSQVARMLGKEEVCAQLLSAKSAEELISIFN
ncbi:PTS sugar transporter subunit IIA [Candidatus Sodalis endolongispinus]|uniref:PTS sugar transporter subunit IIA n=1 Tax=Candidatus Sodalis endolongispinus TaxID=2812662 RepID=A0ABS5YBC2_9GAMM|nr:PTS sugar transporter subunit IIA [Candidatus Sodalis endolongispinus]MBT9432002.1 PTS sugar transporter subunit IIA [Candidatus Sodalis endolongispinus]